MDWLIRESEDRDYARLTELRNLSEVPPMTVAELRDEDLRANASDVRRRIVAENLEHGVVGYAATVREVNDPTGRWWVTVAVNPDFRRLGIGRSLLDEAITFAADAGATVVWDYIRDDSASGKSFAEFVGACCFEHVFESEVDPRQVDPSLLEMGLARLQGFSVISYSDLTSEDRMIRLHDLFCTIEADEPGLYHGVRRPFEGFMEEIVGDPKFRADGVQIIADGDHWFGLSIVLVRDGLAHNQTTGLLAAYRGRGLGLAAKALSLDFCRRIGATSLRTNNHSANAPMLAINRRFGFRPQTGWLGYSMPVNFTCQATEGESREPC